MQPHHELRGGTPGVALRIDVVLAVDVAEDHPLRIGRAAGLAETGFALGGRPLHGVDVHPRALCVRDSSCPGPRFSTCACLAQGRSCSRGLADRGPRGTRSRCRKAASRRRDRRRPCRRSGRRGRSAAPGSPRTRSWRRRRRPRPRAAFRPKRPATPRPSKPLRIAADRPRPSLADRRPRQPRRGSRRGESSRCNRRSAAA